MASPYKKKKLLENSVFGSLVVPVAIVLVGALVVFGVTKMLSTERDYKDLVREMQSKTFGNRWVAAYELSKVLSRREIPEEDIPWMVAQLETIYEQSTDPRTRDFIVVAMGTLDTPGILPTLAKALKDPSGEVQFHAVVALGNIGFDHSFDWNRLRALLEGEDEGLKQAVILAVANQKVQSFERDLVTFLNNASQNLRYSAALGLIAFKNSQAVPVLAEILQREIPQQTGKGQLSSQSITGLKLSILEALKKEKWTVLNKEVKKLASNSKSLKIVSKARELLEADED